MGKIDKSRFKKSKHKDRTVGGFDAVKARNEQKWLQKDDEKSGSDEEESESETEEKPVEIDEKTGLPKVYKKEKAVNSVMAEIAAMRLNEDGETGEKAQPTRREREAMQKEAAKKRYEKLHAEGKTEEAQADLERLAKIRAEREAAKKKREEDEAAAKAAAAAGGLRDEYVKNLGGEAAGKRGKKDKKEKKDKKKSKDSDSEEEEKDRNKYGTAVKAGQEKGLVKGDKIEASSSGDAPKACQRHNEGLYEGYTGGGVSAPVKEDPATFTAGSIEACRDIEEDFM